jgi:hypothetical protein
MNKYIAAHTFEEFCSNQKEMIDILNHRMTKMEETTDRMLNQMISIKTDVAWTKKILWAIFGLVAASLVTIIAKSLIGV